MSTRTLTSKEISVLEDNGCICAAWKKVRVRQEFRPHAMKNVYLSGDVTIGTLEGSIRLEEDTYAECGISNAHLHNCAVGNRVCIQQTGLLSNYDIENEVAICNTGSITTRGEPAFGNGLSINVVNEGGGRNLILTDNLSAQAAYLLVMHRHNQHLTQALESMLLQYAERQKSERGTIGRKARVLHCNELHNVRVGAGALIKGALHLSNGTVGSSEEAPTYVGAGVIARNFILQCGSSVDDAAIAENSLVGQGARIGKQFSMEHSAFFSNAEAYHGEAVSVFAGPHTVTHHKSTLLIGGLFSFFNAGSGTNQSNHMYKLGPVHQGIVERGAKTGSFSYMRWPCKVGAYNVVLDKHSGHFDTSEFPFSYITAEAGKSYLIPAMHFFSAGAHRDAAKWPARDRRAKTDVLDLIHYELLTPRIVHKVVRAIEVLNQLLEKMPEEQATVHYKGVRIKKSMIRAGVRYYKLLIPFFIGNQLIRYIRKGLITANTISAKAKSGEEALPEWYDIAGMLGVKKRIEKLESELSNGTIRDAAGLRECLVQIHKGYDEDCFSWTRNLIQHYYGDPSSTADLLRQIATDWTGSATTIYSMVLRDAKSDFDGASQTGYGADGDPITCGEDFDAVRGTADTHPFLVEMHNKLKTITALSALIRDHKHIAVK